MANIRAALLVIAVLAPAAGAPRARAQSGDAIARRVTSVANGEVRMTYASRPDVCGDGRDAVSLNSTTYSNSSMSFGRWSNMNCVHGPARVSITMRDREIVAIHPHVGGAWASSADVAADLGTVPAADAAAYFISLAPKANDNSRLNPLLAAAIADSANVVPDMLRLARTSTLSRSTRTHATHWAGALGDASVVAPLVELARAEGADAARINPDDVGPGDKLQSAAVAALSMIRDGAGLPALLDLARRGSPAVRKAAVFWLGQREEPQARALVRTVAGDERESEALRGAAIFALGQGSTPTAADRAFLRDLFGKLESERLRDRILMGLAQSESADDARWILAQARDDHNTIEVRRKAVFWAGQGHVPVADIVALYREVREPRLRDHVIFVLSQRDEERATQALFEIARSDEDRAMRKKALFWLAQKDDPRVTKFISDIIAR
jgi:HEAT repeat protein